MTNYSIDGSVYAYPFQDNKPNIEEYNKYYTTIKNLHDVIIEKQPRHKKYFLFQKDINLFSESIISMDRDKSLFDQIFNNNQKSGSIIELQTILMEMWGKLLPNPKKTIKNDNEKNENYGDLTKHIIFEDWFDIEDVIFKPNKEPILHDDLIKKIKNNNLRKNLEKHLAMIVALNKYIYKNNKTHDIVLGNNILLKPITITAAFDIKMTQGSYQSKDGKIINYIHKIKDLPSRNISINKQTVNVSTLENILALAKDNFDENKWETAISTAEQNFRKHILFGPECKTSIEQYIRRMNERQKEFLFGTKNYDIIEKWRDEFPNTLYENIKALNDFISNEIIIIPKNKDEHYHCKPSCELFNLCASKIHFFGVDCVDEKPYHKGKKPNLTGEYLDKKEVEKIRKARTKRNKDGGESEYWLHLRPQTFSPFHSLKFLTLRIHFRLIETKKIEIGWIGEHLYLPERANT